MPAVFDSLLSLLGPDRAVAVGTDDPRYAPHPAPFVHALPRDRDEVLEILRAAARDKFAVVPVGGNTSPRLGTPDGAPYCLLSLEYLDRVVAYEPDDQTLTVEAGHSVAAARELCLPQGLFLAFDPPDPDRATVGGVVAAATEGAFAAKYGPVRDQILGVVAATGDGKLAKAGGRVVKNVTGYDLCRLYTGSRGSLAVLLELTVRLRPIAETGARAALAFEDERAALLGALEVRRKVRGLAQLHVLTGAAAAALDLGAEFAVVATLEGFRTEVEAAFGAVAAALGRRPARLEAPPPAGRVVGTPSDATIVHVAAPPASWADLREPLSRVMGAPVGAAHDVLRGVRETWHDRAAAPWPNDAALDAALAAGGAALSLPGDPTFHRTLTARLPSQRPGGLDLMRKLKAAFDPAGVLNPGRSIFG